MELEQEKMVRAALRTVKGLGSQRLRQLIACFGSALKAWEASSGRYYQTFRKEKWIENLLRDRKTIDPQKISDNLKQQGIRMIIPDEPDYPPLLVELADAPPILFYRGHLQRKTEVLAVVGSRQATAYGKSVARTLARDAVSEGIVIASGLARGIDTAAHQGALEGEGTTWAFLGCGLDRVYPPENRRLAEEILKKGALISEFSLGTAPRAANFPIRNRLISGCSLGVVVVEAAEKSGALITVDFALEQGREVFAVPGPIFSKMSKGPHNLLRQGAKIAEGIGDILNELPAWNKNFYKIPDKNRQIFTAGSQEENEYHSILQQLSDIPLHIDQITMRSSLPAAIVSLALLELQLNGKILQLPGQHYVLARNS